MHVQYVLFLVTQLDEIFEVCIYIYHIDEILQQYRWHIYDMGVDQNIVAGVLLEMTLRPPLRFLALFRVFIVFHYID